MLNAWAIACVTMSRVGAYGRGARPALWPGLDAGLPDSRLAAVVGPRMGLKLDLQKWIAKWVQNEIPLNK